MGGCALTGDALGLRSNPALRGVDSSMGGRSDIWPVLKEADGELLMKGDTADCILDNLFLGLEKIDEGLCAEE
jgi:hypothetical protein